LDEIIKSDIEKAHKNHLLVLQLGMSIKRDVWELAIVLKANRDNKYYKILGYDTFESYLATPEISMSRFFVFKIIKNLELWVEGYKVEIKELHDIDAEKLYIAGQMSTKENYEEILEQARTLSRSDLKQLKSGKEYEFTPNVKEIECPQCHFKFTI
jgi:hypothetical protein